MRTESEKSKLRWFISSLVIVALIINSICFKMVSAIKVHMQQSEQQWQEQLQRQQQQKEQAQQQQQQEIQNEAAAKKAAADAAAEHAKYLARYLNPGFVRKPGIKSVAVAVSTEDGAFNQTVSTALANHLKSSTVETLPAFFKPEFVSDGLINDDFNDSSEISRKLELNNSLDALLLARETVQYAVNSSLDNVLTATMQLEVLALPVAGSAKGQTWTFTAIGTGFKKADAREMAEERLIKQINTDTKISLGQISP